ncbi:hypothetical protein ACCO45_001696 [Purpureocillium lilacinum]|uniref:Uncharacterized protein n=1 Tax=Purpureocillium lilacinum TaxID=33203 RepID=A0ACC4E8Y3_PURLI
MEQAASAQKPDPTARTPQCHPLLAAGKQEELAAPVRDEMPPAATQKGTCCPAPRRHQSLVNLRGSGIWGNRIASHPTHSPLPLPFALFPLPRRHAIRASAS